MSSLWKTIVHYGAGKAGAEVDATPKGGVNTAIDNYNDMYKEDKASMGQSKTKINERKNRYVDLVTGYYDLVTDFYEYGWGQSFHFAPRFNGETFEASIARHEHFLAMNLNLKPEDRVLDCGCGVGGPMRTITRFSGCSVVGVNTNEYQVKRTNLLNKKYKLDHLASAQVGNFMALPFPEASFDKAYAIEATCHAPDKVACYSQIFKTLKPGGLFANYEWVMTDRYDPRNEDHRRIKHGIEKGDGLPDLASPADVVRALEEAGFEVVHAFDAAETAPKHGNDVNWWSTLQGSVWNPMQFRQSKAGRWCTQKMVDMMEAMKIAPSGTSKTHRMLCAAAEALADGGETGVFTPMYFTLARKPLDGKKVAKRS